MVGKKWDADVRLSSNPEEAHTTGGEEAVAGRKLILGVLADCGGSRSDSSTESSVPLSRRRMVAIDRDNFDEVLAGLDVRWEGRLKGMPGSPDESTGIALSFRELEDFHPDSIVQRISALRNVHAMLEALDNPSGFLHAADTVEEWLGFAATPKEGTGAPDGSPQDVPVQISSVLEAILDRQAPSHPETSEIDRLARDIVAPHRLQIDARRQESLTAVVNGILSRHVGSILHDPAFQSLESLWRSLRRLVNAAGEETKIFIIPVSKKEILADVTSATDLESSGLAGLLLDRSTVPGTEHFSILAGVYEFTRDLEDLAVLERLGNIGALLRVPFVAAAGPGFFGCRSFLELPEPRELKRILESPEYQSWHLLRRTPPARWLALAAPRLLCRLPYGTNTLPAETFAMEEDTQAGHETLLWGSPALAVATVFADAFASEGWRMNPAESGARLEGLPLHIYKDGEDTIARPCAEILMTEHTVEVFVQAGLLPLVSHRDTDIISFPNLRTVAQPGSPLHPR